MSGGLFQEPLFDTPDKTRSKRAGAAQRSDTSQRASKMKPAAENSRASAQPDQPEHAASSDAPVADNTAGPLAVPPSKVSGASGAAGVSGGPGGPTPVRSVSEVNVLISRALQAQLPPGLRVRGEISNFNIYSKGHAFFKLKDQRSELPCMMWRNDLEKLRFTPADGLAVIAEGEVKLYEAQGRLQLYVSSLIPQGAGELELAFRQLCDKLRAEGLFDAARKRPIPPVPLHIVVITSAAGDVFDDVLTTAYRRFPDMHIMLFPVQVQGASAAGAVVRAIELVNQHALAIGGVDVILLVRGGGSLEDLWAFNEESVARAIVDSAIPIATGIGHEPDITIADLVADLRGPTPTGVAALVVPEKAALENDVAALADLLKRELTTRCREGQHVLAHQRAELTQAISLSVRDAVRTIELAGRQIAAIEPRHAIAQGWRRLENATQQLRQRGVEFTRHGRDRLAENVADLQRYGPQSRHAKYRAVLSGFDTHLASAMRHKQQFSGQRLADLEKQLKLAGPLQVLNRGFTITTDQRGRIVKSAGQVMPGEQVATRTADGTFGSIVAEGIVADGMSSDGT